MKFFASSKKPSSKNPAADPSVDDRSRDDLLQPVSEPSSPARSPSKSSSHPSKPSKKSTSRPSSYVEPNKASSRSSRLSRHPTDPGHASSRRAKVDPDTHPLNLPPEERKRLSDLATSAMNGNSMDIDREPVNGAARASTPPNSNPSAQANFSVPIPNGTSHDEAPAPPPHKSNPSSPTITPQEDAESYKAAGNRFFKDKNYAKAIEQYSKGMLRILRYNPAISPFPLYGLALLTCSCPLQLWICSPSRLHI